MSTLVYNLGSEDRALLMAWMFAHVYVIRSIKTGGGMWGWSPRHMDFLFACEWYYESL